MRAAATVATLGHLAWLVGNVREQGTGAIERWADDPPSSPFAEGSPARYYPPIVAVALGASLRVLLVSRSRRPRHSSGIVAAGCSTTALAITVVLIRTVNLPLYRGGVARPSRHRLVQRWYLLNRIRIAALACAALASLCCATSDAQRRRALLSSCRPRRGPVQRGCPRRRRVRTTTRKAPAMPIPARRRPPTSE